MNDVLNKMYLDGIAKTVADVPELQPKKFTWEERKKQLAEAATNYQQARPSTADVVIQAALEAQAAQDPYDAVSVKPLAALADAWGGSRMAGAVTDPKSPLEVAGEVVDKLPKQASGNTPLEELATMERIEKMRADAERGDDTTGRFWQRRGFNVEDDIADFNYKTNKEAEEDAAKFKQMEEGFSRGDYQSVYSTLGLFSRSVAGEKGVLTDQDIARIIPRTFQGDAAKFFAYFSNEPTSALSKEFTKNLREMMEIARARTRDKFIGRIETDKNVRSNLPSMAPVVNTKGGQRAYDSMKNRVDTIFKGEAPKKKTVDEELAELLGD